MTRTLQLTGALLIALAARSPGNPPHVGQEIAELQTHSGRVFKGVTIREIDAKGLRIMHEAGFTNVPAHELPQFAEFFEGQRDREPPSPARPPGAEEAGTERWVPRSIDDVVDCCLRVEVRAWDTPQAKAPAAAGGDPAGGGSAFLVNHGRSTYVYSNAHNFDGPEGFRIVDRHGNEIRDFARVEVATDGHGYWKEHNLGGDIVRIRLERYRPRALAIDPEPLEARKDRGRRIVVTLPAPTGKIIGGLEGIITDVDENHVIDHTAATEEGERGCPMVDRDTLRVVGILTWGICDHRDPLEKLWKHLPPEERETASFATGLATVRYKRSGFEQLYQQGLWIDQLHRTARLMGLMDTLAPHKHGLLPAGSSPVMGDYTAGAIMAESRGNPVLDEIHALHRLLQRHADARIGISNQDMLKHYIAAYRRCYEHLRRQRRLTPSAGEPTFYTKCRLENTRALDICLVYENAIAKQVAWFARQAGITGAALPVGKRFRLPAFQRGLPGLGLDEEE